MTQRNHEAMLQALPSVRRFACSLTGNRDDADDLLQATVERVLERGVPEGVDMTRWMFKVCRNRWIDEIRSRTVRREAAEKPELRAGQVVDGDAVVTGELTVREVEDAIRKLPATQREILALVAIQGLSYREAADLLEIKIGTVMSRLARARAALARKVTDERR